MHSIPGLLMHCDFCDGWPSGVLVLDVPSWSVCLMNHIVSYKAGGNGIQQNGEWTYHQARAMGTSSTQSSMERRVERGKYLEVL